MKKLQKLLLAAILCGMAVPVMNAAMGPGGNDDQNRGQKRRHEKDADGEPDAKRPKAKRTLSKYPIGNFVENHSNPLSVVFAHLPFNDQHHLLVALPTCTGIPEDTRHARCQRLHPGLLNNKDLANRLLYTATIAGNIANAEAARYAGADEEWLRICQAHQGLVDAAGNINQQVANQNLLSFCQQGNLGGVSDMLQVGVDANAASQLGNTALMHASLHGSTAIAQLLLDRGADVNAANQDDNTALIAASYSGHTAIVQLLLGRGADANAANQNGRTALMYASLYGHTAIVNMIEAEIARHNPNNRCACAVQ